MNLWNDKQSKMHFSNYSVHVEITILQKIMTEKFGFRAGMLNKKYTRTARCIGNTHWDSCHLQWFPSTDCTQGSSFKVNHSLPPFFWQASKAEKLFKIRAFFFVSVGFLGYFTVNNECYFFQLKILCTGLGLAVIAPGKCEQWMDVKCDPFDLTEYMLCFTSMHSLHTSS